MEVRSSEGLLDAPLACELLEVQVLGMTVRVVGNRSLPDKAQVLIELRCLEAVGEEQGL